MARIAPFEIAVPGATWTGEVVAPDYPIGLIVLPSLGDAGCRDQELAALLRLQGFATVVIDARGGVASDAGGLGDQLAEALDVIVARGIDRGLPIGVSGCGAASAAALIAATKRPGLVAAVVSRGGRLELAVDALPEVHAPTLLVVGSADLRLVRITRDAARRMIARHEVALISGSRHGLDEPGVLDEIAVLCGRWFSRYFVGPKPGWPCTVQA